jgi:hypothetical protein
MEGTHDTAIKIAPPAPQGAWVVAKFRAADAWWLFCGLVLAIKLVPALAGPSAKTLHGRLVELHFDRADRLDSWRSILLLRLPGTLARGLAA